MTRRLDRLRGAAAPARTVQRYSFDQWLKDAAGAGLVGPQTTWGSGERTEAMANNFAGYVQAGYKRNGVVFACVLARMLLFAEARFMWQRMEGGRPGDLWWNEELAIVDEPWRNGTTASLLAHWEQDASLAGNAYTARVLFRSGPQLRRLRPDRVQIVLGSETDEPPDDLTAEPLGYLYWSDGLNSGKPKILPATDVAHYAPIPDPEARFRGMSWLTPVVEEIRSDTAATVHKGKFFDNAATPNLSVSLDKMVNKKDAIELIDYMAEHEGAAEAYKTLWVAGGADVKVIGADMKQLDFKVTQGAGETRIAAAAGVPPIIVGLSEGLEASTYSNYGQARRKMGDHWARPHWRDAAGALQSILRRPADRSRLWYDAEGIAFLQEDQKDDAEIANLRATTIKTLVDAGYDAATVVDAVNAGDLRKLVHSGLFSVQLQKPGAADPAPAADVPAPGGA